MLTKDSSAKRYYFDWAASAPYDGCIINQTNNLALFGNPSSMHGEGKSAKLALEDARARCAKVLNVQPETLFFTSGGTESNSIALFSNLFKKGQGRIISSGAEHSSIREGMDTLERMGKPTGRITVDSEGRVTPDLLAKAFAKYGEVRFVSCMAVNNETGAVTDIASLADVIRKNSGAPVHLHCDLVQAAGKIPIDIHGWQIDSASISAHKIGGPRGIGLLYLRRPLEVFYSGGGQESGVRGGTENTQGALALAGCLEKYAVSETVNAEYAKADSRWNKLITSLSAMERCTVIPKQRAQNARGFSPYILQTAFKDIPGEVMARALDDMGFAVSTGSACSSSSPERPVLLAMGIEEKLRIEGIRISQGYSTTDEEIDLLLEAIAEVLKFL
ncbi:MAG: aminotransferase class V-fold PLP-dependent enzyme [Treponema sp.]|jgi:cysteine desulfurase|nr:aminotransferase class V-fold PLP-dependent enzyme [Treponema sp.]